MRYSVSEPLFEDLLRLQKERRWGDATTERESAVCLFAGFGHPIYLTRDGRVLIDTCWPEETPEVRVANEDEAIAGFVIGAQRFGLPELLDLLPPPPPGSSRCALCTGTRWLRFIDAIGDPAEVVCPDCGGRGWTSGTEVR